VRRTIVILAVATVLLVNGIAQGEVTSSRCLSTGSRTLATTNLARIYKKNGKTFGCLYSVNRRLQIGTYGSNIVAMGGQRNVRVAGRFVAFEQFATGKDLALYTVKVYDLRTRRPVIEVGTGKTPPIADFEAGIGPTTRLRLRPTGQVAWIARDLTVSPPRYEVHTHGRNDHVLASGADIEPASLGLIGNRLSWKQAGKRYHTTLGPVPNDGHAT
jgi:hypothetical protein